MKKTLLAGASLAVMFTAASALAAEYSGKVETTPNNSFYIESGSTLRDADFALEAKGTEQTANRVSFGAYEADNTITVLGDNSIKDFATVEPGTDNAKTTFAGGGNLSVEGYMTSTRNANVDFSDVNLTFKKGEAGAVVGDNGALVLDNDTTAFKVGNVNFTDGTRISLYKAQAGENSEEASGEASNMQIAAGKTVTFEGNNKIAPSGGDYAKNQFNIKGENDSNINVNGNVKVAINTSVDGANLNIDTDSALNPARMELADNSVVLDIKNSNVNMAGAPDGKLNGITGDAGTVNLGENTNVNISKGAGIAVSDINVNDGAVVNASGYMEVYNQANPQWQAGSIIEGLNEININQGATVNIADGAQIVTGYNSNTTDGGFINVAGTVNMSGDNALVRASSKKDGTATSTLNVSGAINILKESVGIIASRLTEVVPEGIVKVAGGSTLNLLQDMNRGAAADEAPEGDNAKFNVAGSLVNNGIINAEKTDITIKGDASDVQAEGGKYIADNGTLNGGLILSGKDNSAKDGDTQIAAAPKADFSGANIVKGNIDNTRGLITVRKDASLTLGEGSKVANNGIIDLSGTLNGTVEGSGNISVQDSAAHVISFSGNSLEIKADTASSRLVDAESTAKQIYVSKDAALTLDNENLKTAELVTYGTANLGVDYNSNAKVGNSGTLNLASNTLTGNVALWGNSNLVFNVDKTKSADGSVQQAGGKIFGAIATYLNSGETAVINPVLDFNAGNGTYQYADSISKASGELSLDLTNNNVLYNVAFDESDKSVLNVAKKSSGEVASDVVSAGGNAGNANTVNAWVGGNSNPSALTGASKAMAEHLNTLAQTNPGALIDAVTALAPETAATVQSVSTENANQIFSAVGSRLSGGSISTGGEGMSSGDGFFKRGAMWVQGLVNHSKLDDTRKAKGFDADSQGIALGAEKYVNDDVKLGLGYAYTSSDIDGFLRSTDVDTHTAIAYGEYKPSNWYVNGIATYGWSDYSEKKNVAGMRVNADYDVDSIGLQALTGYDFNVNGTQLTPEAGLRYVNIRQDSYRDTSGQKVSENTSDILTGVIGAKIKKEFVFDNGMTIRPEARLAMTYDMVNDANNSVVTLANGSAYSVNGQALDRLGWEAGAGLSADVNENVELSLGYEGKFRDHYKDHTGLINAKYKF